MKPRIRIRPASAGDIETLSRLRVVSILASGDMGYSTDQMRRWAAVRQEELLLNRVLDGCLIVAEHAGELIGFNGLELDQEEIAGPFVHPEWKQRGIGRRLVAAIERLAVRFGSWRLSVSAALPSIDFFKACGYRAADKTSVIEDSRTGLGILIISRSFPRRQTRYGRRIGTLHNELRIPAGYGRVHRIPLQPESSHLTSIGPDIYGRDQRLHPSAAKAWAAMLANSRRDGIELQAVSAFRSAEYQAGIFRRKLEQGQKLNDILHVSAAPGYSEHHTGRALDISTPGFAVLEEEFELSPAFNWLADSADNFGFKMSSPRGNRHNVAFEPWHWAWSPN